MATKKIALVHDYLKEYGGAERVLETLHEMYPNAPVFTLVYCPEFLGPHAKRFKDWDIRPSILQKIPFRHKLISPFRLLAPFVFPLFDLSDYDVVIVSATGAYSPNTINTKSKVKHICYYHTPPRYLYGFATARQWQKNPLMQAVGAVAFSWLRKVDIASSKNVDVAIANSQNVAERIKKFYHKEAVVIYPPVDIKMLDVRSQDVRGITQKSSNIQNPTSKIKFQEYYLAGGRLARPKHIDLIVKACIELGVPLKVFGKSFAGYGEELHSLVIASEAKYRLVPGEAKQSENKIAAGRSVDPRNDAAGLSDIQNPISNIEFLGEVTDEEKLDLMRGAKAFLFAAEDEDFGIVPVEAMGVGTPVIAYRSGGPKESIIGGKTGIFFDTLTVKSVVDAVKKFQQAKIDPKDCISQAEKFNKKHFEEKIKKLLINCYAGITRS